MPRTEKTIDDWSDAAREAALEERRTHAHFHAAQEEASRLLRHVGEQHRREGQLKRINPAYQPPSSQTLPSPGRTKDDVANGEGLSEAMSIDAIRDWKKP